MRRTVPLMIAAICGTILIITAFIPATVSWGETAAVWFDILAAIAFLLGGGNLMKVHLKRISDRVEGWAYSVITVVTFLLTLSIGLLKLGVSPGIQQEYYGETFAHCSFNDLPDTLNFEITGLELPVSLAQKELPASVRSQFSIIRNDQSITGMKFRGWMTASQQDILKEHHKILQWQAVIEELAEVSSMPTQVTGDVQYRHDHRSLSVAGPLSEVSEEYLRGLSQEQKWQSIIDDLATRSRIVTSMAMNDPPGTFAIPEIYQEQLDWDGKTLTVTGPVSEEMKSVLQKQFPLVRPMTDQQITSYVEQLKSLPGDLTEEQTNAINVQLRTVWSADQLILALNDAGIQPMGMKSSRELLEEQQSGVEILKPGIPAETPDVSLNEQQIKFIKSSVTQADYDLHSMGVELSELGDWTDAQESALQMFLASLPSVASNHRSLAVALTLNGQTLSTEQYEFLLADYRQQHFWNEQIHQFMLKAHRVKYPWSGDYRMQGSPFWWSFEYSFKPLVATMFSLLAFYVASAAFRAFRAKNFEALLLLGTAFIILLGRTFAGSWLTSFLPDSLAAFRVENITMFIMSVINTAGNRAIMIGISLGIVSTSLKILLGVDRSYLGTGDD